MATDTNTASIIPLHQPKTPLTPAQRARAYRLRQKAAGKPHDGGDASRHAIRHPAPADRRPARPPPQHQNPPPPPPPQLVPVLLTVTAFGLALVGITMNGSFAIPTVSK